MCSRVCPNERLASFLAIGLHMLIGTGIPSTNHCHAFLHKTLGLFILRTHLSIRENFIQNCPLAAGLAPLSVIFLDTYHQRPDRLPSSAKTLTKRKSLGADFLCGKQGRHFGAGLLRERWRYASHHRLQPSELLEDVERFRKLHHQSMPMRRPCRVLHEPKRACEGVLADDISR